VLQQHRWDVLRNGRVFESTFLLRKSLEIYQRTLPPNHPDLAVCYNNTGFLYETMGEYSKALSFYEKSLEILQKTLSPIQPLLATSYYNIAHVYYNMREHSKALAYFERALNIRQHSLPPNHPDIQSVRNNIEIVKGILKTNV